MSQDIDGAFNHYVPTDPVTCSNTSGKTVVEVTLPDGSKTLNVVDWLGKERLFETTAAHIIIFSGLVFLLAGIFLGVYVSRNDVKCFVFDGKSYSMVGIGEFPNGNTKIYAPVYEVKK